MNIKNLIPLVKVLLLMTVIYCVACIAVSAYAVAAAKPVIFYTDIISGPGTGGENNAGCYLTIFGKNLGNTRGNSSVTVGGGDVYTYKVWTDSQVSVQIGPHAVDGDVMLTTSAGTAIGPEAFDVRSGEIYFISDEGDDQGGDGAFLSPYRTPNKVVGLSSFGEGDFLYVRGGVYDLDSREENLSSGRWLNVNYKNGSEGRPITFSGYPGEIVTVQIDSPGVSGFMQPSGQQYADYWVVANFTDCNITSARGGFVFIGYSGDNRTARYGRYVNIDIEGGGNADAAASPFEIGGAISCRIYGISVHDSSQTGPSRTHWIYVGNTSRDLDIGWCKIYNCKYGRAAFQIHSDGAWPGYARLDEITVHDCVIYDVPAQAFLVGSNTGNIKFYNNLVYNANQNNEYDSAVISLRGNGGAKIALYHNTIFAASGDSDAGMIEFGISSLEMPESVDMINNIFYLTDSNEPYYTKYAGFDAANITSKRNVWFGASANAPSWDSDWDFKTADPNFIDVNNFDFRLMPLSKCVNSGSSEVNTLVKSDLNGILRDEKPDIGVYEFADIVTPSAPMHLTIITPVGEE